MKLSAFFLFPAFLACATAAAATEYPWSKAARACGQAAEAALHAKTGCASCADAWPSAAWCALHEYYGDQFAEPVGRTCINRVWQQRLQARTCNNCGNPIDQVFACVQKP